MGSFLRAGSGQNLVVKGLRTSDRVGGPAALPTIVDYIWRSRPGLAKIGTPFGSTANPHLACGLNMISP